MSKRKEHIFIDGVECKHCSKCGEYKPLNEFDTCTSNWDKLQRACKSCRSIYGHSEQRKQYNNQISTMASSIIGVKWVWIEYITINHIHSLMLYLVALQIIDVEVESLLKSSVS